MLCHIFKADREHTWSALRNDRERLWTKGLPDSDQSDGGLWRGSFLRYRGVWWRIGTLRDLCQSGCARCWCFCWSFTGITVYMKLKVSIKRKLTNNSIKYIYSLQFTMVSFFLWLNNLRIGSKSPNNWHILHVILFWIGLSAILAIWKSL